ncbi:predicted protein [Uncinocarpus reesii 1704]|uniref:15-hydroxyprostaglandin dehydrogenase n=1 Tax=Uncinocarpus reesii (strain UAMH 1704) TaxID=336963 RepID=C4JXX4_UNCRE|nr:uncharacterized protein UREG_07025 [Uncinocarpus reesii 1704]EEP82160.1 predicted protein [Uncinocarpus reesii 1704]
MASGIGLALSKDLLSKGWRVCMCDIKQSPAASGLGENAIFVAADVTDYDSLAAAFVAAWTKWNAIHFVAANAGIADNVQIAAPYASATPDSPPPKPDLKTIDVDLTGVLYTIYLSLHYFRQNPCPGGKIVATSSSGGLYPLPYLPLYTTAKHAIVGLVRALAPGLQAENITINCLCPGLVATGLSDPLIGVVADEYLTPVSTLLDAVSRFLTGDETGRTAELSVRNLYMREPPEFPDKWQKWAVENLGTLREQTEPKEST